MVAAVNVATLVYATWYGNRVQKIEDSVSVQLGATTAITDTIGTFRTNVNATDEALRSTTSSDPGHVHTTAGVSGTIAIAKGGLNTSTVPADDRILVGDGTNYVFATIPDCGNASTSKIIYTTSTNSFSCVADVDTDTGGTLLISRNATTTNFNNSSAANTIASSSIPSGTLSTNNGVRMRIAIRTLMNATPGTLTVRLTYGGQNLATSSRSYAALAAERGGWLDAYVFAVGSTTVQKGFFNLDLEQGGDSVAASGFHTWRDFAGENATSSVNSGAAQTMAITWEFETASAANSVTSTMFYVEKLATQL